MIFCSTNEVGRFLGSSLGYGEGEQGQAKRTHLKWSYHWDDQQAVLLPVQPLDQQAGPSSSVQAVLLQVQARSKQFYFRSKQFYFRVLLQSSTSEFYFRVLLQSSTSEFYFRVLLQSSTSAFYFSVLLQSSSSEFFFRVLLQCSSSSVFLPLPPHILFLVFSFLFSLPISLS